MDRADSPSPSATTRPRRPKYLVFALLLVWLIGLSGATNGFGSIQILHDPLTAQSVVEHTVNPMSQALREAMVHAVLGARAVAAPLGAAGLLLGSVLALAAGATLFGRGRARGLLVQAIVVYAAFLPVAYFVGKPIRAGVVAALAATGTMSIPGLSEAEVSASLDLLSWWWRFALGAQLVTLALALFALTRPRVRAFFVAMQAEGAQQTEGR